MTITNVSVRAVPGGAKLSVEGFVPIPEGRLPSDDVLLERRSRALKQIEGLLGELLFPPLIHCSGSKTIPLSDQQNNLPGHNQ